MYLYVYEYMYMYVCRGWLDSISQRLKIIHFTTIVNILVAVRLCFRSSQLIVRTKDDGCFRGLLFVVFTVCSSLVRFY